MDSMHYSVQHTLPVSFPQLIHIILFQGDLYFTRVTNYRPANLALTLAPETDRFANNRLL